MQNICWFYWIVVINVKFDEKERKYLHGFIVLKMTFFIKNKHFFPQQPWKIVFLESKYLEREYVCVVM